MAGDYGPVPISRLKDETTRMFAALKEGRRVLISRQGRVVAQIEPPSATRHLETLVSFAVDSAAAPRAVSPTMLSQGAGSEAVHAVERGEVQVLTRRSKVLGILSAFVPSNDWATIMERERAMQAVETALPEITPEQFQKVVDRYAPLAPQGEVDGPRPGYDVAQSVAAFASSGVFLAAGGRATDSALLLSNLGALGAYRHAQFARATALRLLGDRQAAEVAFLEVVDNIEALSTPPDEAIAVRSYLALADIYNASARPKEALDSAEHALNRLKSVGASIRVGADA